jgi:hypothetical protein
LHADPMLRGVQGEVIGQALGAFVQGRSQGHVVALQCDVLVYQTVIYRQASRGSSRLQSQSDN